MTTTARAGLGSELTARVKSGRKLVVPYITCGLPTPPEFIDLFVKLAETADAIEVGIPFSDPVMDGPVIQESSGKALESGVTVDGCLGLIKQATKCTDTPAVVMTYYNIVHSAGLDRFAQSMANAGVRGLIVPDLPFEECGELRRLLADRDVALIQLVSPTTPPERASMLAADSGGWVYAVSRMGVTGEQTSLAGAAREVVERTKPHTDLPVLIGLGISSPELAVQACESADGVIVGSAVVKRVLADDLEGAVTLIRSIAAAVNPDGA